LVPLPPGFFVSVASKEFSVSVSGLESTLAGISISVASKGLRSWRLEAKKLDEKDWPL
jgi:hypothetical protein